MKKGKGRLYHYFQKPLIAALVGIGAVIFSVIGISLYLIMDMANQFSWLMIPIAILFLLILYIGDFNFRYDSARTYLPLSICVSLLLSVGLAFFAKWTIESLDPEIEVTIKSLYIYFIQFLLLITVFRYSLGPIGYWFLTRKLDSD